MKKRTGYPMWFQYKRTDKGFTVDISHTELIQPEFQMNSFHPELKAFTVVDVIESRPANGIDVDGIIWHRVNAVHQN